MILFWRLAHVNRWCSLFNADLALSVTMTAISTFLSIITLPANLLLYANITYQADVTSDLDWVSVFVALAIVISAIALGLFFSYYCHSYRFNIIANQGEVNSSTWWKPLDLAFFPSWYFCFSNPDKHSRKCRRFTADSLQCYHDQHWRRSRIENLVSALDILFSRTHSLYSGVDHRICLSFAHQLAKTRTNVRLVSYCHSWGNHSLGYLYSPWK